VRRIPVLQIGLGGVGQALVEQVLAFNERLGGKYGFRFAYIGLADRQGAVVADDRIPPAILLQALATKRAGGSLHDVPEGGPLNDWRNLLTPSPCLLIDATAQSGVEDALISAIEQGYRVVLANKKPLCAGYQAFRSLTIDGHTRYEATVGAGLPIISTLRSLLDTGDTIRRIEGCFSGTLGFLVTQLERGVAFSAAVRDARQRGWTEPDPRDDLSGTDVARKALILARSCGLPFELADVGVGSLVPAALAELPVDQFMQQVQTADDEFRERWAEAAGTGKALRYVAEVTAERLNVGLATVLPNTPIGSLQGPDNLVVYQSERYAERPLSVRGPGAGTEITAAALLGDMIAFAREWNVR
jgi:homoserine dehydrogenase